MVCATHIQWAQVHPPSTLVTTSCGFHCPLLLCHLIYCLPTLPRGTPGGSLYFYDVTLWPLSWGLWTIWRDKEGAGETPAKAETPTWTAWRAGDAAGIVPLLYRQQALAGAASWSVKTSLMRISMRRVGRLSQGVRAPLTAHFTAGRGLPAALIDYHLPTPPLYRDANSGAHRHQHRLSLRALSASPHWRTNNAKGNVRVALRRARTPLRHLM